MKIARRFDRRAQARKNHTAVLRNRRRAAVKDQVRRALMAERLEDRSLLAADFLSSYYNFVTPTDVDADGTTAPGDALTIINSLNATGSRELPQNIEGEGGVTEFVDVDNDGFISPGDALTVINTLNAEEAPPDQDDRALYTLVAVKPGTDATVPENVITNVQVNQDFDLVIFAEDLRVEPFNTERGVFAGYLDLNYDEDLVQFRVAEVQQLTTPASGSGRFRLTVPAFGTQAAVTTPDIAWTGNQSNAGVRETFRAAVENGLNTALGAGSVKVSLIGGGGFNVSIWFTGFFDQNIPKMQAVAPLTGTQGTLPTVKDASDTTDPNAFQAVDGDISIPNSFLEAFRSREVVTGGGAGPYQEKPSGVFVNATGTVDGTVPPTAAIFNGSSGLSSKDKFYEGAELKFTSGALAGQSRIVTGYVVTETTDVPPVVTRTFTFATPFDAAPAAGDSFTITGKVDELGFFTSSLDALGTFPFELSRVRVKATLPGTQNSGQIVFSPYVGDQTLFALGQYDGIDRPAHNTLEYADSGATPPEDQLVEPGEVAFNVLTIDVTSGPLLAESFSVSTPENTLSFPIDVLSHVTFNDPNDTRVKELRSIGTASTGGTVTIDTRGTPTDRSDDRVLFSTVGEFNGQVTFTYTAGVVGDTESLEATGLVTVNVTAVNDAPTINDPTDVSVNEQAQVTVQLSGIGPGGGADEANQTLTVTAQATGPNASLIKSIVVNYTPGATTGSLLITAADEVTASGTVPVTVTVNDGGASNNTATQTFNVTVNPVNDAPHNLIGGADITGANNTVIAPETTFTFTGATQLSVSDVDAGTANITTVLSVPTGDGTLDVGAATGVTVTGDGTNSVTLTGPQAGISTALTSVTYTVGATFKAAVTLTMRTTDNASAFDEDTITISRDPGVRPFAVDDSLAIDEGTTAVQTIDVLANDFKLGTATTTVVAVTQPTPAQGSVAFTSTGVTYTPPGGDFFGTVTFTYTIDDDDDTTTANLDERTGNVVVTIRPVNDTPVAVDDNYQTAIGVPLVVTANGTPKGLLFNDTDADGDTLTAVNAVIAAGQGTVTLNANGDGGFTYTPPAGGGDFSFTYDARDPSGATDTATVRIHVAAPPVAVDDTRTATEGAGPQNFPSVLGNDSDPTENQTLSAVLVSNLTEGGTVLLNPDGTFTYTPVDGDFNTTRPARGPITFTYRATAGGRDSNIATVAITVNETNDAPTANDDDFLAVRQQSGIGIDQPVPVLVNDRFAPDFDETLTVVGVATSAAGPFVTTATPTSGGGSVRVSATGQVLYTSPTSIPTGGADTFFYQIRDRETGGLTDVAQVNVSVVDFVPKSISGIVYVDSNNDGVKDASEVGLAGVEVRLTGTAFDGTSVNFVSHTDINGNYVFPQAAGQPGVEDTNTFIKPPNAAGYTITEIDPLFLLSGIDSESHPLVTNADPFDNQLVARWDVTDSSGDITGLNFGERGVDTRPVSEGGLLANTGGFKQEYLASSGHNGFVIALDSSNHSLWSWTLDDPDILGAAWANTKSIIAVLSPDLTTLTLTCTLTNGQTQQATLTQGYSIPGSTARFRVLATGVDGQHIIRIDGSYNGDGDGIFLAAATQAAGGPEGEPVDQQYAQAADAVFAETAWA